MNVKIQGGDDAYSNTGSYINVACYLEHEDYHRMEQGLEVETFFTQGKDNIQKRAFVLEMDSNKAKLCKNEAKFYVMTISPSKAELDKMGRTEKERSIALKQFVREKVIPLYANGFGKDLTTNDIMYFAKIHHTRDEKNDRETHCHIVISRKTKDNRLKISPRTNHRKSKTSGVVKSGFDRTDFYQNVETEFDKMFDYQRTLEEKFEYLNVIKNGDVEDLEKIIVKDRLLNIIKSHQKTPTDNLELTHNMPIEKESTIQQEISFSSPDIFIPRLEEDETLSLSKKKKKSKKRGSDFSM